MAIILGITGGFNHRVHDAAACLSLDGKLVFAQEEERFSRVKHSIGVMPTNAIKAALASASLDIRDIDCVAYYANYGDLVQRFTDFFNFIFGYCPPIKFVEHHHAHAASAFYYSGFDEAMILTADLSGNGISTTLSYGKGNEIKRLKQFRKPNSLGLFYGIITQLTGFQINKDEYKVMGLASYGEPTYNFDKVFKIEPGHYHFNPDCINMRELEGLNLSRQEKFYSNYLSRALNFEQFSGVDYLNRERINMAASVQKCLNDAAVSLIKWLHKETGTKNLCIAGAVGLNCIMNQQLIELDEVENIFVQPAASDAGASIGALADVSVNMGEILEGFPGVYLGNEFNEEQILAALKNVGVSYEKLSNKTETGAKILAEGKILGWYQGRHEMGPRALGNRSILADPRIKDMKDRVNFKIKYREGFRPFAPSILREHAEDYFELKGDCYQHMTVTCNAREDKSTVIPSVVHVDGTSRVQTVSKTDNALYHELLTAFHKETGSPVVLNTSFNLISQPIVNTPYDALATYFSSGIDALVIGDFLVKKL